MQFWEVKNVSKVNRIPDISDERLIELYHRIRPIARNYLGTKCWLKEFDLKQLRGTSIIGDDSLLTTPVIETGVELREIGSFRCLHTWTAPAMLHPTIAEVLAQIPESLVESTATFEIITPQSMNNIFDGDYHVTTVVLYAII